jgi:extracellular factor (EF) 3-hydroxypalmitic acid methyl ester biosynthesis protein
VTFAPDLTTTDPVGVARELAAVLQGIHLAARREARSLPRAEEHAAAARGFRDTMRACSDAEAGLEADELTALRALVREQLNPWLLRSRYWNRAYVKPHGYAGDFRMLEWIYDLEDSDCADPLQPAVVNVLDRLFADLHSAHAVWRRRAWFARLVRDRRRRSSRPLRILDIACGGSRYLRDEMDGRLDVTFLDQDPAALTFVEQWLPAGRTARLLCAPVRALPDLLAPGEQFDLVLSTGLFDYLPDADGAALAAQMCALRAPGGSAVICNFAPSDPSRAVTDWICDWPLIYRDAAQLRGLFAEHTRVRLEHSPGLVYATAQRGPTV